MIRPNGPCITPTGSEAKSNRTVKGSEAIKSLVQMNEREQGVDGITRGNVAGATETRLMQEYCSWQFIVNKAGDGEDKCDEDVEQSLPRET